MRTVVAAAVVVTALAGCHSAEKEKAVPSGDSASSGTRATPSPSAALKRYTAEQLAKALITPPAGAAAVHRASGTYADVVARQPGGAPNGGGSTCFTLGRAEFQNAPSASVDFAQLERSTSVGLLASPGELGRRTVLAPTAKECRSVKGRMGGKSFTSKVVTDEPFDLADGGRIRSIAEMNGGLKLHAWDVAFAGPGYIAECAVLGTHVTRADAERLARQEYSKAKATLR